MIPLAPPSQEGMGEAFLAPQGAAPAPPLQEGMGEASLATLRQPLLCRGGWGKSPWRPRALRHRLQWRPKMIQCSGRGGNDDSRRQQIESKVEGQGGYRETTQRGTRRNAHNNQTDHAEGG